jgi:hypothetical protein
MSLTCGSGWGRAGPGSSWVEQDRRPHAEHRRRNQIAAGIPRCAVACRDETGQNQRCEGVKKTCRHNQYLGVKASRPKVQRARSRTAVRQVAHAGDVTSMSE